MEVPALKLAMPLALASSMWLLPTCEAQPPSSQTMRKCATPLGLAMRASQPGHGKRFPSALLRSSAPSAPAPEWPTRRPRHRRRRSRPTQPGRIPLETEPHTAPIAPSSIHMAVPSPCLGSPDRPAALAPGPSPAAPLSTLRPGLDHRPGDDRQVAAAAGEDRAEDQGVRGRPGHGPGRSDERATHGAHLGRHMKELKS